MARTVPLSRSPSIVDVSALRLCVLRLGRRMRQHAAGDVTPSQLSALSTMERWGPLRLSELGARERIGNSTVTRLVDRLDRKGYVSRSPDPDDGRVAIVALEERGRQLLAASRDHADSYLARQVKALPADEQAALARALPVLERLLEVRA
jgi:DNA-binding MarR family transcriptional regulator